MHYGYRKKRLYNFPLLHYAPIPKCFDCFMLTFIVPIWDKKFQIFRVAVQTQFSWSNARSLKETFTKKSCVHNSRSAQRICAKFSTRIRQGARKHPHYNFPRGSAERPIAGGQFLSFPGVPPWEAGKIFASNLGESRHTIQDDHSEYGGGVYFLWTQVFGTKKPVFVISGQFDKLFRGGPNSVYGTYICTSSSSFSRR